MLSKSQACAQHLAVGIGCAALLAVVVGAADIGDVLPGDHVRIARGTPGGFPGILDLRDCERIVFTHVASLLTSATSLELNVGGRWQSSAMTHEQIIAASASCVETANLIVQIVVAVAAVAAAIIALLIGARDRKKADEIAKADRVHAQVLAERAQKHAEDLADHQARTALEHEKLMFDLGLATRLLENIIRSGSVDTQESKRMGAEALALIGLLGPKRLPQQWARRQLDNEKLKSIAADESKETFIRNQAETQLMANTLIKQITDAIAGRTSDS